MGRINLAELANDTYEPGSADTAVSLEEVAANPLNPRTNLGDLAELTQSLETAGQLQPCTAVTALAYLNVYPEHRDHIGDATYVVIMGGRRLAAAQASAQIHRLDITVKDDLARSREVLAAAAVIENIERRGFDPIEEARAVQHLTTMFPAKQDVARHLSRSNGWVSQRLALLKLHPDIQTKVQQGSIGVREARELVKLPTEEQLAAWEKRKMAAEVFYPVKNSDVPTQRAAPRGEAGNISEPRKNGGKGAVRLLGSTPQEIAATLREQLSDQDRLVVAQLLGDQSRGG